jgi:eukaryotic-like serine/threonine-protein kinase
MATVHVGRLTGAAGFARTVAIKRMHPHLSRDREFAAMFVDEARLAARIHHPNVVQTLDVETSEGELFVVMEYLQGESLATLMRLARAREIKMPLPIAVRILIDVLYGLQAAHEATSEKGQALDLVHRDISPQNVLVGADGVARVIDFGVAKAVGRLITTKEGYVKGKLSYMAPEQISRDLVDRRTDVYAAAVVLWELLTMRRLFKASSEGHVMHRIMRGDVAKPSSVVPEVPADIDAIVMRGLAVDPAARFPTAQEMASALESKGSSGTAREVGEWVKMVAGDALKARAEKVAEVEFGIGLSTLPIPPASRESSRPSRAESPPPSRWGRTLPIAPTTVGNQAGPMSVTGRSFAKMWGLAAAGSLAAGLAIAAAFLIAGRGARPVPAVVGSGAASARTTASEGSSAAAIADQACPSGMVAIPGGRFFMGADDATTEERPAHQVVLRPFCIDRYEVTVADYKACSDVGGCRRVGTTNDWEGITDRERGIYDPLCTARYPDRDALHPVNCVDWTLALDFCRDRGKRLPTEAEWEFAARGPDGRNYPWGDEPPSPTRLNGCGTECVGWAKGNGLMDFAAPMYPADDRFVVTAPVGSFPEGASPYGPEDMAGNVWEWVADWWDSYRADVQTDPVGPAAGTRRVIRGGAWNSTSTRWVRATFRSMAEPTRRAHGIGFRCAR